jgi:hypothetical protein
MKEKYSLGDIHRSANNIKIILANEALKKGLGSTVSGYGPVVGCCEQDDEHSDAIKADDFFII